MTSFQFWGSHQIVSIMKFLLVLTVFLLTVNARRQARVPLFGRPLNSITGDPNDVAPIATELKSSRDVEQSKIKQQKQIEQIQKRLTDEEKSALITEAEAEDPEGFVCQNEIIDIKEVTFVDQVRCYNSSEEVCSMTQKTVFQAQTEKKCDTHFVKECWIDYKEIAKAETVRICTKKPERICNLPENHTYKIANECRTHYETVCQTRYMSKNVTEDEVKCSLVMMKMNCDDNGNNCMEIPQKQCNTVEVVRLKSIPSTSCDQAQVEICTSPACPLVVDNEVCQDVEKTFVSMKPIEQCELNPRQVCYDIVKQYPTLKMVTDCQILPRETCNPERVRPKEVTKPVIKKICSPIY